MSRLSSGRPGLRYQCHGEVGAEGLVFVNGLGAGLEGWFHQQRFFSEFHRVLCFDNRGAGGSEVLDEPVTMRDFAQDLVHLLDELALERCAFVGLSFGARILQELALGWPHRVRALVLGGSGCRTGGASAMPSPLRRVLGEGGDFSEESFLAELMPLIFGRTYLHSHARHLRVFARSIAARPPDPRGLFRQWEAHDGFDCCARLAEIEAPVLVLHGEEDALCSLESARQLAQGLPRGRLVELAHVGHSPHVEAPLRFNRVVHDFLCNNP